MTLKSDLIMVFYGSGEVQDKYLVWSVQLSVANGSTNILFEKLGGGVTSNWKQANLLTQEEVYRQQLSIIPGDKIGKFSFFASLPIPDRVAIHVNHLDRTFLQNPKTYVNPLTF